MRLFQASLLSQAISEIIKDAFSREAMLRIKEKPPLFALSSNSLFLYEGSSKVRRDPVFESLF